jgi:class 3 adenylate cyclase
MTCPRCAFENPPAMAFCGRCGARLPARCPSCGYANPEGFAFCCKCGTRVAGDQASPPETAPAFTSPRSYTPKHLADKILQSRSALEGERKQVTVLFADVKGSMELAEQIDPEKWHTILERFFEILTEGVHRFEGTVNQYTGDGIMALFGAPIAHEDHAQRACHAALHLGEALRTYADELRRTHTLSFAARIGLNSGDVVVGRIGDDLRMDYTAQGHTVGLAQRMEQLAEPGTTYLTAHTAVRIAGYFGLDDLGEFAIKGVTEPLRVFRLRGIGSAHTRFDIARARGLSRFVGRATDLRALEDSITQAAAGNGEVIGIIGEAGTGKSRLCFELLERCRARGMPVYECRAVPHGRNIPFLPILEQFRAYFDITSEDDEHGVREKIASRMASFDTRGADMLPLLFDFLGVADPQRPPPRLSPEVRQRQLLGVMLQVVQGASATQPAVTLIEDLHWLDAASGEFLAHMVEAQAGSRNLLLVTFRPEYRADWMQKSWYRQIPLAPLGRDAITELLADLLGVDQSLTALVDAIQARTRGNPFFTEEVVQSLIESRHLQGSRGAYRLATPIERLEVPADVQTVLAARIDRMPEREKRLLQVASIIGKNFSEPLLAAVAGLVPPELKAALAALQRAEFIYTESIYPIAEYSFKHPLTQEVAQRTQLREHRRSLHAAVAAAIEQQASDRQGETAALLAHHWEEAGEMLTAARWNDRAAEWARRTDLAAAVRHSDQVRTLLRGLPRNRDVAALGISACTRLLSIGWRIGMERDAADILLKEGQRLAEAIGDRRAALKLALPFSLVLGAGGDSDAYIRLSSENRTTSLSIDDVGLQANAWAFATDALGIAGRLRETLQLAEEGLARFPRHSPADEWLLGLNPIWLFSLWRGMTLSWMGELAKGIDELKRAHRLAEEDGTPEGSHMALAFLVEVHCRAHDANAAMAGARRADDIGRSMGEHPGMMSLTQTAFGHACLAGGRAVDAVAYARSALSQHTTAEFTSRAAQLLPEALLEAGDPSSACDAAQEAIRVCHDAMRGHYEAAAQGVLARALLRRDGPAARAAAESVLASAAALIESTGAKTLAPALAEWRAELAAVLGDDTTRTRLLEQARRGYQDIGAPKQAERLAHELAT